MHTVTNGIRLAWKEEFRAVSTSSSFTSIEQDVEVSDPAMFPWLSSIATQFTKVIFHGLVVTYVSTSGKALNSTNAALGSVTMAGKYDILAPPFASEIEMLATPLAITGGPDENLIWGMECAPETENLRTWLIRLGPDMNNEDDRWKVPCTFTLATSGSQASYSAGRLFVSYDVTLLEPRISNFTTGLATAADHWTNSVDVGVGASNYFGALASGHQYGTLRGEFAVNSYTFPEGVSAGYYLVEARWLGDSGAVVSPTMTITNGTTANTASNDPYNSQLGNGTTSTTFAAGSGYSFSGTSAMCSCAGIFKINAPGSLRAIVTFSAGTLNNNLTRAECWITPLPAPGLFAKGVDVEDDVAYLKKMLKLLAVKPSELERFVAWFWAHRTNYDQRPSIDVANQWLNDMSTSFYEPQEEKEEVIVETLPRVRFR
jgi:hypothetical protein